MAKIYIDTKKKNKAPFWIGIEKNDFGEGYKVYMENMKNDKSKFVVIMVEEVNELKYQIGNLVLELLELKHGK